MPTEVDPKRFAGKPFVSKRLADDEFSISIDGLHAGRIMRRDRQGENQVWIWSLTGPFVPTQLHPISGEENAIVAAQEKFEATFWKWHSWAMSGGKSVWHFRD